MVVLDLLKLVALVSLIASTLVFLALAIFRKTGDRSRWDKTRFAYSEVYHQQLRRRKQGRRYDKAQEHRVRLKSDQNSPSKK